MQGVLSGFNSGVLRTRGRWKRLAAILSLAMGLAAGLTAPLACAEDASPVVRFYNERTGTHFYTIDTAERDQVLRLYPWFDYEGVQFYAYKTQVAGSQPVYRFFNTSTGTHFYTIVPDEKDYVLAHFPVFAFEGPVYYAMNAPMTGSEDLYRFFNTRTGAHFYTTSAPERDHVQATWPWFTFEGVAYQVFADGSAGGGDAGGGGGASATTTTLQSSANPAAVGAAVTFTATVAGIAPSGSVRFAENGTVINGCAAVVLVTNANTGTAACSTTTLTAGSHTIMASYVGDSANAGSDNTLVEVINGGATAVPTTTTLSTSVNPASVGESITLTAFVVGDAPTGIVNFTDNAQSIGCSAVSLSVSGMATCSTTVLATGPHNLMASYGGDAGNLGSVGELTQFVNAVGPVTTMTTLVTSANPAASGASVTFTATVTGKAPTGSCQLHGRCRFDRQLRSGSLSGRHRQFAFRRLHDARPSRWAPMA